MASILFTSIVSEVTGKVQGSTFIRNRYGFAVKRTAARTNRLTAQTTRTKRNIAKATMAWKTLSTSDQNSWEFASPGDNTAYVNFLKYNSVRVLSDDVILATPAGASGLANFNSLTVALVAGSLIASINVSTTEGPWLAQIFLSRAVRQSLSYIKKLPRYAGTIFLGSGTQIDVTDLYMKQFGQLPAIGEQLAASVKVVNSTNAQIVEIPPFLITVQSDVDVRIFDDTFDLTFN